MKKTIEVLIKNGYTIKYDGTVDPDDEGEVILTNGILRIGIFPGSYPHELWNDQILAEHDVNFDKWSKYAYMCDIPTAETMDVLLADLEYISTERNVIAGDKYSTLVRTL